MSKLLRKARVVQLERALETADVLINDGVITAIGQSLPSEAASVDEVIELEGYTLFPGFLDVHIHGAVGVDTLEATGDDLDSVSRFLAGQGVTGWLPTFVPAPVAQYGSSIDAISKVIAKQEQSQLGARVLGVHYEGPFVNTNQCGALHTDYFRTYKSEADLNDLPVLNDRKAVHMI